VAISPQIYHQVIHAFSVLCGDDFVELGLEPAHLERGPLEEVIDVATRYGDRCDRRRIPCTSRWTADCPAAFDASTPAAGAVVGPRRSLDQ
jgi:hypothetical protein